MPAGTVTTPRRDDHWERRSGGAVASVSKAMEVLQAVSPIEPVLSVRRLAFMTGMPRSTIHGLCRALVDTGMLQQVPARGYRLGPALVGLGGQVIERTGLVEAAEGVLAGVVWRRETEAHLAQLVDGWVVYLGRASGLIRAPMNNRVGLRALAHLTGCGRAALSQLDPEHAVEAVERACRAERAPLPRRELLLAQLRVARTSGYAVCDRFQSGRLSVAAAVLDAAGTPVGAVSIAGPTGLLNAQLALGTTVRDVTAAAREIGLRLPSAK